MTSSVSTRLKAIYLDFEYNDTQVICCALSYLKKDYFFDLRTSSGELSNFLSDKQDCVLIAFSLNAEIGSLLRLGIDVRNFKCIDLLPECRMITMSHPLYFDKVGSLLSSVKVLLGKGKPSDAEYKKKMHRLILDNHRWSDSEWAEIKSYCLSDISELAELWTKIVSVHLESGFPYEVEHALNRGKQIRHAVEMDHASAGFPVGAEFEAIYENKQELKTEVIKSLPSYWRACYRQNKDGSFSCNQASIAQVIQKGGWSGWPLTNNGGYSLKAELLEKLEVRIPEVTALRKCRDSLQALNSEDLRPLLKNGYVNTSTFMYCAVTGRNGLKPKKGFIFNLPPWIRKTVCPEPGKIILGADFSQQEIAIAAKLSGDEALISVYNSGDVYLALGKMAGAIPENGTKKTHNTERAMFKILQLGLSYGKELGSLTNDLRGLLKDTLSEAEIRIEARSIYEWHKGQFKVYWNWIAARSTEARQRGWIQTSDNWMRYVDSKVKSTQLLNFPSQSEGAVMLRIASEKFYTLWQAEHIPPILVTQHDAAYFNADEEDEEKLRETVSGVMRLAALETIGLEVRSDISVYTSTEGYKPEKWRKADDYLWKALQEITAKKSRFSV